MKEESANRDWPIPLRSSLGFSCGTHALFPYRQPTKNTVLVIPLTFFWSAAACRRFHGVQSS